MGIDVYLKWKDQSECERRAQHTGFSTTAGNVGYLREAYHGGPYATRILCREAFEAEECEAQIPAAVLRERLTHVTEPARGVNAGHELAAKVHTILSELGVEIVCRDGVKSSHTPPQTAEEAIHDRYQTVYPGTDPKEVEAVVQSFRDFVALAEKKEAETGAPCTIYASY
jgi:hypothetical protein